MPTNVEANSYSEATSYSEAAPQSAVIERLPTQKRKIHENISYLHLQYRPRVSHA